MKPGPLKSLLSAQYVRDTVEAKVRSDQWLAKYEALIRKKFVEVVGTDAVEFDKFSYGFISQPSNTRINFTVDGHPFSAVLGHSTVSRKGHVESIPRLDRLEVECTVSLEGFPIRKMRTFSTRSQLAVLLHTGDDDA